MKKLLFGLTLMVSVSSFANSSLPSSATLDTLNGKWVMTESICNSSQFDPTHWTSSFLDIKGGEVESRVSGANCMTLEKIIYSKPKVKGDIISFDEIATEQLSKVCFEDEYKFFDSDSDDVKSVTSKLLYNKNRPHEFFLFMKDADCGGGKGMTVIYSKYE